MAPRNLPGPGYQVLLETKLFLFIVSICFVRYSFGMDTTSSSSYQKWHKSCLDTFPSTVSQDSILFLDLVDFINDNVPGFIPLKEEPFEYHSIFYNLPEKIRYHFINSICNDSNGYLYGFCQLDDDERLLRSISIGGIDDIEVQSLHITGYSGGKERLCMDIASTIDMLSKQQSGSHIRSLTEGEDDKTLTLFDYEAFEPSLDCPCIDTPETIKNTLELYQNNESSSDLLDPDVLDFIADVGSFCFPWALLSQRCINSDTGTPFASPKKCREFASLKSSSIDEQCCGDWCFVDPNQCTLPHNKFSDLVHQQLPILPFRNVTTSDEFEIYLSYETCGNVNYYGHDKVIDNLKTYELRVGIPGDSSDGYTLTTTSSDARAGSMYEFMNQIWVQNEMKPWLYTEVTQKSKTRYSTSSYTACVHDIALGELDMCIGAFWTTTERLLMSSFTNTIYNDEFYLIVFKGTDEDTLLDLIERPFKPFESTAWLVIVVAFIYMALTISFIQDKARYNDEDDSQSKSASLKSYVEAFGNGIYNGLNSFTRGEVLHASDSPSIAERIATSGFVIFALIVLTAYTATSAAFMVDSAKNGQFNNIQDVIDVKGKICIPTAVAGQFGDLRLDAKSLLVPKNSADEIFDEMNSIKENTCVAAVLDLDAFSKTLTKSDKHCDKMIVGDVLMMLGNAIPINAKYREDLTYIVDLWVSNGNYQPLKQDAINVFLGAPICSVGDIGQSDDSEPTMTIQQLAFPFFIAILCTTIGLIIDWFEDRSKRRKKQEIASLKHGGYGVVEKHDFELIISKDNSIDETSEIHKEEDDHLQSKVRILPISTIITRLEDAHVDEALIVNAINLLPDTTALSELLYTATCSSRGREKTMISNLSTAELLSVCQKNRYFDVDYVTLHVSDPETFRSRLTEFIMHDRNLRIMARKIIDNKSLDNTEYNKDDVGIVKEPIEHDIRGSVRNFLDGHLAFRKPNFSSNSLTNQCSADSSTIDLPPPTISTTCSQSHDGKLSPLSNSIDMSNNKALHANKYSPVVIFLSFPKCKGVNYELIKEMVPKDSLLSIRFGIVVPVSKQTEVTYESIRVELRDDTEQTLESIVEVFFKLHDPTENEISAIFTTSSTQFQLVKTILRRMQEKLDEGFNIFNTTCHDPASNQQIPYRGINFRTKLFRASKFADVEY